MPFINIDLSKLNISELITTTEDIITAMTGNADFPSPPQTMIEVGDTLTDLKVFNKQKELLSQVDRIDRKKIAGKLVKQLKQNGQYVIMLFPEDESKQLSSGYPSSRKPERLTGPPQTPTNLRVRHGQISGQVIANCKRYRGTKSLNVKIKDTVTNEERIINSSSSVRIVIDGLMPGRYYEICVQAVGARGNSDWTSASDITAT